MPKSSPLRGTEEGAFPDPPVGSLLAWHWCHVLTQVLLQRWPQLPRPCCPFGSVILQRVGVILYHRAALFCLTNA